MFYVWISPPQRHKRILETIAGLLVEHKSIGEAQVKKSIRVVGFENLELYEENKETMR